MRFAVHINQAWRVVFLAVLAAVTAPEPALAAFSAPVWFSGRDSHNPKVAVDSDGNALIVWSFYDGAHNRIQARARSAAGVLGPIQTLSPAGVDAYEPVLAVHALGDAVIVWSLYDGANYSIQARARSAAGVLGLIQTLSAAGINALAPQIAMLAYGDALIVWQTSVEGVSGASSRVQARSRSAAGVLGPIQTLSVGFRALFPQVALDKSGGALVVWDLYDGANFSVQARSRSAAGVLGPIQTLSGYRSLSPQFAVDSSGEALIVWYRSDASGDLIQARARSAAGVLGPIETISSGKYFGYNPYVARDYYGNSLIVWNVNPNQVQARKRSADGVLGPLLHLSPDTGDRQEPDSARVAMVGRGDAVIAWRRNIGFNYEIEARTLSASGELGSVQELGSDWLADKVQVAMDIRGRALVVWERSEPGYFIRIQGAAGP